MYPVAQAAHTSSLEGRMHAEMLATGCGAYLNVGHLEDVPLVYELLTLWAVASN